MPPKAASRGGGTAAARGRGTSTPRGGGTAPTRGGAAGTTPARGGAVPIRGGPPARGGTVRGGPTRGGPTATRGGPTARGGPTRGGPTGTGPVRGGPARGGPTRGGPTATRGGRGGSSTTGSAPLSNDPLEKYFQTTPGYAALNTQYQQDQQEYDREFKTDPEDEATIIPIIKKLLSLAQQIDQKRTAAAKTVPPQVKAAATPAAVGRFKELIQFWQESLQEEIQEAQEEGQNVDAQGNFGPPGAGQAGQGGAPAGQKLPPNIYPDLNQLKGASDITSANPPALKSKSAFQQYIQGGPGSYQGTLDVASEYPEGTGLEGEGQEGAYDPDAEGYENGDPNAGGYEDPTAGGFDTSGQGYENGDPNAEGGFEDPNAGFEDPNAGYEDPNAEGYEGPNAGYEGQDPNAGYEGQDPNASYEEQDPNAGYEEQDPNAAYEDPNAQGYEEGAEDPNAGGYGEEPYDPNAASEDPNAQKGELADPSGEFQSPPFVPEGAIPGGQAPIAAGTHQ